MEERYVLNIHLGKDRLLFSPVMSILLGISASLHTACCAQQRGEAGAAGAPVSACQSQSQGSVNSHHSEKLCPDVTCLQNPGIFFVPPPPPSPPTTTTTSPDAVLFYPSCGCFAPKQRQTYLFCLIDCLEMRRETRPSP